MDKVIAIDGPSGSGKSTLARKLAKSLDILYINTGAMFRALAYICDEKKIKFSENDELKEFLNTVNMEYGSSTDCMISIDGQNLTTKIREHHVSKLASIISQLPSVRNFLLNFQRQLAKEKVCVMEGRDIGTVVFPEAFSKFFVTASVEIRANRRLEQLKESGQVDVTIEKLIEDVKIRDAKDSSREISPLKQADDAMLVDTSHLSLEESLSSLLVTTKEKAKVANIQI